MLRLPKRRILLFLGLYVPLCVVALDAAAILRALVKRLLGRGSLRELLTWRAPVHHAAGLLIVLFWVYAWRVEPHWVKVARRQVHTAKLVREPFRIAQISDVHSEAKAHNEPHLPGIVNPLRPDVIVFTGDALNTAAGAGRFRDAMAGLEARLGKFAVIGNMDIPNWEPFGVFDDTGFEVLEGRTVRVARGDDAVYVTGLTCGRTESYRALLSQVPEGCFSILLYHTPDLAESLDGLDVDLYLSGHTHGGQVALPLLGPVVRQRGWGGKYVRGAYTVGQTTLYVNPGLGMEVRAPRVRFGVRPEVTVFDVVPRERVP
jgi:predicted MPP superfamily phosphohydrolase